MNTYLLRTAWKWQRIGSLVQRVNFNSNVITQRYATGVVTQRLHLGTSLAPVFDLSHHLNNETNTLQHPNRRNYVATKPLPKPKSSTVDTLLEKLDAQHQLTGQLNHELAVKLLELLEADSQSYNQLLTVEHAIFLLRACGTLMPAQQPGTRMQLFERLWNYLAQHAQLGAEHYRLRLHVLQHNRTPLPDHRAFLQELSQLDAKAAHSPEVYSELLAVACSSGNMQQATEVLSEMREKQFALAERNFNALIIGHGHNHDLDGCRSVVESMAAADVTPSTNTHSALAAVYLVNGEASKAGEMLSRFHRQFEAEQIVYMLRTSLYTKSDVDLEVVAQLVRELPTQLVSGPEMLLPLRHLCIELLHSAQLPVVKTIIATLPKPEFNENQDIDTYGVFLLQELFRAQQNSSEVIEMAVLLRESGKNTRALHIATEIALRRNTATALPFLEALAKVDPLRPHYFWPLLLHGYRREGEMGILQVLRHMRGYDVMCDRNTLTQYVLPHLPILLERPEQAVRALDEAGVKPSQVLVDILGHMLSMQQLEKALSLLELYPTKFDVSELLPQLTSLAVNVRATKRYQQFAKTLSMLAKKHENLKADWVGQLLLSMLNAQSRLRGDVKAFERFIGEMSKFGLTISRNAADAIVATLQQHNKDDANKNLASVTQTLHKMCNNSLVLPQHMQDNASLGNTSSFIKHPRDMTLDELECHLVELEAKRLNTRGVLRRLLQLCVRDSRLERALEIKTKCDALQVQISPGMLASIFEMYIKLKDLPNAEASLKRLRQTFPAFSIDEHKIIDYAALLVHEGQLEAGKQILQEYAATQKIAGGDYVIKNVWNFLTNVAHLAAQTSPSSTQQTLTRETFQFLQKLHYCNAHNAVLGPIVREHLLRGDVEGAVAEFRKLAEQYKHTPLQFELLSLLVRLSNGDAEQVAVYGNIDVESAKRLLGEVTSVIGKVHGTLNMNSALLLALAESGTENQLRRLLIDPEFRVNQEQLLKNCEHLGQDGAVTTLLRLARGARGLSRTVDEQGIYNMLLSHFTRSNNYEAALDLYERLEADDELKISQEFLRNLVHLLRVNKVDVPSNVALRAQVI